SLESYGLRARCMGAWRSRGMSPPGKNSPSDSPDNERLRQQISVTRQEISDLRATLAGVGRQQQRSTREQAFEAQRRLASRAVAGAQWEWDIAADQFQWSDEFYSLHELTP